jgi:hypothetical protein
LVFCAGILNFDSSYLQGCKIQIAHLLFLVLEDALFFLVLHNTSTREWKKKKEW